MGQEGGCGCTDVFLDITKFMCDFSSQIVPTRKKNVDAQKIASIFVPAPYDRLRDACSLSCFQ